MLAYQPKYTLAKYLFSRSAALGFTSVQLGSDKRLWAKWPKMSCRPMTSSRHAPGAGRRGDTVLFLGIRGAPRPSAPVNLDHLSRGLVADVPGDDRAHALSCRPQGIVGQMAVSR